MDDFLLEEIATTISKLENSGKILQLVNTALEQGISAIEIVEKGLRSGLDDVGRKYENHEYYLAELLYASDLAKDAMQLLEPYLNTETAKERGTIIVGTVQGDIHDIGKNIFKMYAQASGFEVHDLGVDVEPQTFINRLKETNAEILSLSALLTTSMNEMEIIIELLKEVGIRNSVKVLLGGAAVTKEFGGKIGADGVALDAIEGIDLCKRWVA